MDSKPFYRLIDPTVTKAENKYIRHILPFLNRHHPTPQLSVRCGPARRAMGNAINGLVFQPPKTTPLHAERRERLWLVTSHGINIPAFFIDRLVWNLHFSEIFLLRLHPFMLIN